MNKKYIIEKYCIIRDNTVSLDDKEIYHDEKEKSFSDFSKGLYKYSKIDYPKFYKMDNLSKLGFITSELLLKDHEWSANRDETGLILCNSSASLDTDINHQKTISNKIDYFPSPAIFVYTLPNIMIGEICIRHKITGESAFYITEHFDSSFIFQYVNYLFEKNIVNECIAGWVEKYKEKYESVLFLIKKKEKNCKDCKGNIIFDIENIEKIYNKKF